VFSNPRSKPYRASFSCRIADSDHLVKDLLSVLVDML
jgi:hypothetical protein